MIPKIKIEDFSYPLPEDRIAKYPLEKRDTSKLLIYNKGKIVDDNFSKLDNYLPQNSFLVYNDTKVVPARLFFKKESGAVIEILTLSPSNPIDYSQSFASTSSCEWSAVVGNLKKWKDSTLSFISNDNLQAKSLNLRAILVRKDPSPIVRFIWDGGVTFSQVLQICGTIPIPPYLNRESQAIDKERYQTVYAKYEGSIAAPTAGLHFTDEVLNKLKNKNITTHNICLHVGAGTFMPVKSEYIRDHTMHSELFSLSKDFLIKLINLTDDSKLVSVGTTTTRTLESLYYIGVNYIENNYSNSVDQWAPYLREYKYSLKESLRAIVNYLEINNLDTLIASTSIIIVPGFKFRLVDVQITNFHQPQSTLLLLIAALVGDSWRQIYSHALANDYRFLSYGDSSLLFRG